MTFARMAELVDAADSKSAGSDIVRVQVPLLVPVGFSEHITDHFTDRCLIVLFRTLTQFSIIKKSFFFFLPVTRFYFFRCYSREYSFIIQNVMEYLVTFDVII